MAAERAEQGDAAKGPAERWAEAVVAALALADVDGGSPHGQVAADDRLFRAVRREDMRPGQVTALTSSGRRSAVLVGVWGQERITNKAVDGQFVAVVWLNGAVTVARVLRFDAAGQNDYVVVDRMRPAVPLLV